MNKVVGWLSVLSPANLKASGGTQKEVVKVDAPSLEPIKFTNLLSSRLFEGLDIEDKLVNVDEPAVFPLQPEIARLGDVPLDSCRKICIALKSIDDDLSAVHANSQRPLALNGMPVVGLLQQVVTQSLRCRLELLLQLRLSETYDQHQKLQDRWTAIRKVVDNVKTMPTEKAQSDLVFVDLIQAYENAIKLHLEKNELLEGAKNRTIATVSKIGQFCIIDVRQLFGIVAEESSMEDIAAALGTSYEGDLLPNTQYLIMMHTTAMKTLEKLQELCNNSTADCTKNSDILCKNLETLVAELESARAAKIQRRYEKSLAEEDALHAYEMERVQRNMEAWKQYQYVRHEDRKACIQTGKEPEKMLPQTVFYAEELHDLEKDIEVRRAKHEETKKKYLKRIAKEQAYLKDIQSLQDLAQVKKNQILNTKRAFNTVVGSSLKLLGLLNMSTQEVFKKVFQLMHDLRQSATEEVERQKLICSEYRDVLTRRLKQKEKEVEELPQQIEQIQKAKEKATMKADIATFTEKIKKLTQDLETAQQEIGVITKRLVKLGTRDELTDSTSEQVAQLVKASTPSGASIIRASSDVVNSGTPEVSVAEASAASDVPAAEPRIDMINSVVELHPSVDPVIEASIPSDAIDTSESVVESHPAVDPSIAPVVTSPGSEDYTFETETANFTTGEKDEEEEAEGEEGEDGEDSY